MSPSSPCLQASVLVKAMVGSSHGGPINYYGILFSTYVLDGDTLGMPEPLCQHS